MNEATLPVFMVHGFNYDPQATTRDNPYNYTFPLWEKMIGRPGYPHAWFSVPLNARNIWRAWRAGRWNRYRYAWDLAGDEAIGINPPDRCDVVCHSLGTRVVLTALLTRALPVRRVLLLNGAEYASRGLAVARKRPDVEFFNIVVPGDDVLNTLARFAPGFGGAFVGNAGVEDAPANWRDIRLDDPLVRAWGRTRRWSLAGDKPHQVSDHWYSFEHRGNWPLYRAILGGDDLADLPR